MGLSWKKVFANFNLFYFFMMIMYAARGNVWMNNMYGFTGDFIAVSLPVVLTIILIKKNRIKFYKSAFLIMLMAYLIWWICVIFKFNGQNLSLSLFMFMQLVIAYCICQVYKMKMFYLYEQMVTKLSLICLFVWLTNLVIPQFWDIVCPYFAFDRGDSICKYNFFFASVLNRNFDGLWYRNPGFSWEPGMNASLVSIAIFINLVQNQFRLKNNKNLYILLTALLSSFSTTGYMCLIGCLIPFYILNKKIKFALWAAILLIPVSYFLFQLDFMGNKIQELQTDKDTRSELVDNLKWNERGIMTPQRFDGLAFELMNVQNDPILGYGVDVSDSFVSGNISDMLNLSNGAIKLYSQYGLIFGIFLTFLMILTCIHLGKFWECRYPLMFFILYESISISYSFYHVPLFMAFFYNYILAGNYLNKRIL